MASNAIAVPAAQPVLATPVRAPGTRRRQTVQYLECGVIICWILTTSSGCFGFYLGFDTKVNSAAPMVCQRLGDSCEFKGSHEDMCNACHRTDFDPILILISFYQVMLGLVGLLVSCGSAVVASRFGFLRNRFGRGFLLFFIGTLSIAQGLNFTYTMILTLVVGCIDTAVGFFMMISYVCVSSGKVYDMPGANLTHGGSGNNPALTDAPTNSLLTITPGR